MPPRLRLRAAGRAGGALRLFARVGPRERAVYVVAVFWLVVLGLFVCLFLFVWLFGGNTGKILDMD